MENKENNVIVISPNADYQGEDTWNTKKVPYFCTRIGYVSGICIYLFHNAL